MKAGHYDQINEDYLQAMFWFGKLNEFENDHEKFKARITAVGNDGRIILKRENGVIEQYAFKEVKFVM